MMAHPKAPTDPITLRSWRVERSGNSQTAHGIDIATGEETKITNIEHVGPPVRASDHHVLAHAKNGVQHVLTFAL
jgi:hypothetical protein